MFAKALGCLHERTIFSQTHIHIQLTCSAVWTESILYKFDRVIGSSFLLVKKQTAVDVPRVKSICDE